MNEYEPFVNGALTYGCLVIALHFLRYWRLSRDGFFLWFVAAFVTFAVSWGLRATDAVDADQMQYVYLPRLAGFLFIVAAILHKNRSGEEANREGRPSDQ